MAVYPMEGRGLNSHLELRIFFWVFLSTYIILFARIWILNLFSHKFNNSNNNNNYKATEQKLERMRAMVFALQY